jgi:hypothetical protein
MSQGIPVENSNWEAKELSRKLWYQEEMDSSSCLQGKHLDKYSGLFSWNAKCCGINGHSQKSRIFEG